MNRIVPAGVGKRLVSLANLTARSRMFSPPTNL
jgi:hypothetical protein